MAANLHILLGPDAKWIRIANLADHVISGAFGDDGYLYLLSRQQAPKGKVLKLSLSDPQISRAKEIIAESDIALKSIVPGGGSLYVIGVTGGPSEVPHLRPKRCAPGKGSDGTELGRLPAAAIWRRGHALQGCQLCESDRLVSLRSIYS